LGSLQRIISWILGGLLRGKRVKKGDGKERQEMERRGPKGKMEEIAQF